MNKADANMAHVPASVPDEMAVYCADMLSTGFMDTENGTIQIGGTVAIFAQGSVGLMATVGTKLRGAGLIIRVEMVQCRQELARTNGADVIADFSQEDVVQRILDLQMDCVKWPIKPSRIAECITNSTISFRSTNEPQKMWVRIRALGAARLQSSCGVMASLYYKIQSRAACVENSDCSLRMLPYTSSFNGYPYFLSLLTTPHRRLMIRYLSMF